MHWRRLCCVLLALTLLTVEGKSQALATIKTFNSQHEQPGADVTISGRVTDAMTNEALAGCSVVLKGTQRGTTTEANGDYRIAVPEGNAVLVFGFIGFVSQEIAVGNQSTINVSLKASASVLSLVVVIGYGSAA